MSYEIDRCLICKKLLTEDDIDGICEKCDTEPGYTKPRSRKRDED